MGNHTYVPSPWPRHLGCVAKFDDGNRVRTCGEPASAEVHQVSKVVRGKKSRRRSRRG